MLELLRMKGDEQFEHFCRALEATGQGAVVGRYLQQHRVCVVIERVTYAEL